MVHSFDNNVFARRGMRLAASALGLSLVFGGVAGYVQNKNARCQPVAFSEFGKTARSFEGRGEPVPALTHFYSITNDMAMQVFEAFNHANGCGTRGSSLAAELEFKTDRGIRVHRQIGDRAKELPAASSQALKDLEKFTQALAELPAVVRHFEDSWTYHRNDIYVWKTRTRTVCDLEGKNCRPKTETYREYARSVHDYRYSPENGKKAAVLLGDFLMRHPDLIVAQELVRATSTEADNEYAIETSMKNLFDGKMPGADDYLAMANSWADGSNYTKYRPVISAERDKLEAISPKWREALRTARSQRYTTHSRSDSGPHEYRVAEAGKSSASTIIDAAGRIVGGIVHARRAVPELQNAIDDYIEISLNGKKGDAETAKERVLETAREIYEKNYESGLPVRPFDWGVVGLFAILGGALGAAGVAGFEKWQQGRGFSSRRTSLS